MAGRRPKTAWPVGGKALGRPSLSFSLQEVELGEASELELGEAYKLELGEAYKLELGEAYKSKILVLNNFPDP